MNDKVWLRSEREKIASDTTDVWENSLRLHRRFSHVFYSPNTMRGESALQEWLTQACQDATVLEIGCSDGRNAQLFRQLGAKRVIGADISEVAIAEARSQHGDLGEFYAYDAQRLTMLPDSSVDAVFGRSILHHLDFFIALQELSRVLRKGGSSFFVEPLYDNPASIVFRKLTPKARTVDERPLSRAQIAYADNMFTSSHHCYCNLVTTPVGMITSLLALRPDNLALRFADVADRELARTPLRHWMRMGYFCWES